MLDNAITFTSTGIKSNFIHPHIYSVIHPVVSCEPPDLDHHP